MKQSEPVTAARESRVVTAYLVDCSMLLVMVSLIVVAIFYSLWGPDAPRLETMALKLANNNDYSFRQALLWQAALTWRQLFLGPDDPAVVQGLTNLSSYYVHTRQLDKVEPLLQRALSIYENRQLWNHTFTTRLSVAYQIYLDRLTSLTPFYIQQQRYHNAAAILRREYYLLQNARRTPDKYISLFRQQCDTVSPHVPEAELPPRLDYNGKKVWGGFLSTELTWQERLDLEINRWRSMTNKSPQYLHAKAIRALLAVYDQDARFNFQLGQYSNAEQVRMNSMGLAKSEGDICNTLSTSLLDLAATYEIQGKYPQAVPCYRSLLSQGCGSDRSSRLQYAFWLRHYADLQTKLGKLGSPSVARALDARAAQIIAENKF